MQTASFSWPFSEGSRSRSIRQRIRPELQVVDLRAVGRAAFVVEYGARARHGPQALALPAGLRVVDAAVDQLAEEAARVGHMDVDDLAVDDRHQRLAAVHVEDRHVVAEAERVVAVHPYVVRVIRATGLRQPLELRPGHADERPAFRAELAARRFGPVLRLRALAPVKA